VAAYDPHQASPDHGFAVIARADAKSLSWTMGNDRVENHVQHERNTIHEGRAVGVSRSSLSNGCRHTVVASEAVNLQPVADNDG
jgi:hypothetical protein